MDTKEFLSKLDYSQLAFAKARCTELMEKIEREEKVPLWIVSDEDINWGFFEKDQYKEAVECLCKQIMKTYNIYGEEDVQYNIQLRYFKESEVKELLKLN